MRWLLLTLYDKYPSQDRNDTSTNTEPDINEGANVGIACSLPSKIDSEECYKPEDKVGCGLNLTSVLERQDLHGIEEC